MRLLLQTLLLSFSFLLLVIPTLANTEKAIFISPSSTTSPPADLTANLSRLSLLPVLTPENATWRTHLPSEFPSETNPHGVSSWMVLGDLKLDTRYEVRVCWSATNPTVFRLTTHRLSDLAFSPPLLSSLTTSTSLDNSINFSSFNPFLLLRIETAANFFSADPEVMKTASLVYVDVILDEYWMNIIPMSLLPTIGVIFGVLPVVVMMARGVAGYVESYGARVNEEVAKKRQ